jgi:tungstate transport system ATP-binding protein
MTASALIDVDQLAVRRGGVEVIALPRFSLKQNELVSVIGPNGAGKSSLLLALARLIPAMGRLCWRGEEVGVAISDLAYRRRLAMVFQEPLLFDATVFENVAAGLKIRGGAKVETKKKVMEALSLFGIGDLAWRSARKLSGGESQRTSLARAFATEPELILLDEPFAALDPPTRMALMDDLESILAKRSISAILATHDQMEALRLTERMLVVNQGKIIQEGPPVEVMNRPVDEFVAGFVGMENVLSGVVMESNSGIVTVCVADERIECSGNNRVGDWVVFCISPENVVIDSSDPRGETSARNVFKAVVRRIVPAGVVQRLYLDCGFPLVAYLTSQSLKSLKITEGSHVFAAFKATAVHMLKGMEGRKYE